MTSGPSEDEAAQLKEQIEQTREELGRTAEQLAAKADVKARAQAELTDLKQRAAWTAGQLRRQAVTKGLDGARKYRIPVIITTAGLLVTGAALLVRSRRPRS